MREKLPYLGFGLGLRSEHYEYILEHKPDVDWFEIITENYLVPGGKPLYYLDQVTELYPVVMHGVSLSIASVDPLNWGYLKDLKQLAEHCQPKWISDHICWTGVENTNMHDLLPVPYTEEALNHMVDRIAQVQDFLGRRILLENVSSYITYKQSEMTEWEFVTELATRADCYLLLDINNIFVSGYNHRYEAKEYIDHIPVERVQQFHLAGHCNKGDFIIDTHDHDIIDEVWNLYKYALERFGEVSTMIERDDHIPEFPVLHHELMHAKRLFEETLTMQREAS